MPGCLASSVAVGEQLDPSTLVAAFPVLISLRSWTPDTTLYVDFSWSQHHTRQHTEQHNQHTTHTALYSTHVPHALLPSILYAAYTPPTARRAVS
jgi:hypothetical protein